MTVAPLQFPGLNVGGGKPFLSPHQRVVIDFYAHDTPFGEAFGTNAGPDGVAGRGVARTARITATPLSGQDPSEPSLVDFQWNKAMGQPSGRWTAQVKPGRDKTGRFYGLESFDLVDGDWADISVIRNGLEIPVCRGIVDSIRERKSGSSGATVVTWTITGRDHGALFEYPITWSNLWAQTVTQLVQGLFTERVKGRIGGAPDEMFRALIQATFAAGKEAGHWAMPSTMFDSGGERRFIDELEVVSFGYEQGQKHLRGAYYNELQLWTQQAQNLWQTLGQWANPLLNEYWVDLILPSSLMPEHNLNAWLPVQQFEDGSVTTGSVTETAVTSRAQQIEAKTAFKMAAFVRERPFLTTRVPDPLWYDLPTWTVPTWLLEETNLGRSGDARYNVFSLLADYGMSHPEQQAAAKPVWSKEDVRRRGLRAYEQTTRFYGEAGKKTGLVSWLAGEQRATWQGLLVDWTAPVPLLLNGTAMAKLLLPGIRIGQKVALDDGGPPDTHTRCYVEGVNLRYQTPNQGGGGSGETSLILTHGFRGTDADHGDLVKGVSDQFEDVEANG